ncbi:MAG TPA: LamG domain-containing protein, partial [Chitinophagaceae bacterium]|nr:LamG domain-containing protein [Chitinophagaceae bacterium]
MVLISFFSIPAYSQSLGSMYAFDGVDDCVSIPAHPSYAIGTADFTIEFWMKLDSTAQGSGKVIFSMQDSATLYGIYIVTFNNSVGLNFQFSGGGSGCYTGSLSFLFDGQCHHYAWVRSGKRLRIYVDGALNITYNNLTTLNIASNDILLGGSKNYFPGNSGLKGALRDFKIWSTPLSQYQIINWLKPTSNNQITNLIGAWKLDGTYKQKVEDKSIKQNHGTRGRSSASESSDPVVVSACPDCIMHPVQLFALNPLIFCIGDSVTMKVTLLPGETCRWYKNGILINGAIDSVYTTKYSGIYSVRVFNSSGCFGYSNALTLKRMMEEIDWPACASCYGVTGEYCWWNGRHDTLTMPVYTGYSYQWYKDSVLIPGATSNTLPVASAGQYYCVVQWNGCSRYSNTARYLPLEATITAVTSP